MKITRDRLHLLTGITALGFGIYCLIIGIGAIAFDLVDLNFIFLFFCFLFGILYIIFGISTIRAKEEQRSSFMAIGFMIGIYWWGAGGLPWFIWPMIIMPFVILILSLIIISRKFKGLM